MRRRRRRRVRAKIVSNRFVRRGSPTTRVAQRGFVDVVLSRRHMRRVCLSLCERERETLLLYNNERAFVSPLFYEKTGKKREKNGAKKNVFVVRV